MQQHGSKYIARRSPHGMESKGQNLTFSEHDHVAYQIKGNHECSNMVANIFPADPRPLVKKIFSLKKIQYFFKILP